MLGPLTLRAIVVVASAFSLAAFKVEGFASSICFHLHLGFCDPNVPNHVGIRKGGFDSGTSVQNDLVLELGKFVGDLLGDKFLACWHSCIAGGFINCIAESWEAQLGPLGSSPAVASWCLAS